jgi:hypothetical protein
MNDAQSTSHSLTTKAEELAYLQKLKDEWAPIKRENWPVRLSHDILRSAGVLQWQPLQ